MNGSAPPLPRGGAQVPPGATPAAVLPPELRSIVILRLRSIGDAVLMTPLLAALRSARPRARIAVVLEEPQASLLAGHPDLDEVVVAGRGLGPRLRVLRQIRAGRHDVALDLHGGPTAALLTRFSGARLRVGLLSYRARGAYDVHLPAPFKGEGRTVTLHTLASNLALARSLGLEPEAGLVPRLPPPVTAAEAEADAALAAAGAPGDGFVVVHPGAALRSKAWPRARFLAVARALAEDGEPVVLVRPPDGTPGSDESDGSGVARGRAAQGIGSLPGVHALPPVSLRALHAVLRRARLFIGNDSGPAHIAAAASVPTVTVFGSQDPRVWSPVAPDGRVLWRGLPCSPCSGVRCANPDALACLHGIAIEEVLSESRSVLARR